MMAVKNPFSNMLQDKHLEGHEQEPQAIINSFGNASNVKGFLEKAVIGQAQKSFRKKIIKKRVRNRYGSDTRHMGFSKHYVINDSTGRANQLFKCLFCPIKTPKLCNMLDHQKTHKWDKQLCGGSPTIQMMPSPMQPAPGQNRPF